MFRKTILTAGMTTSLLLSSTANAVCYYYIDVLADAGTYSPKAMNEDLVVDPCGSTVHHAEYIQYNRTDLFSFGLCDMPDKTEFTLTWTASLGNSFTTLGTYSGAAAFQQQNLTFDTGVGTFFSAVGTYTIGLYLNMPNNSANIPLPNGHIGNPGSDSGFDPNNPNHGHGWRNADLAFSSFTLNAASVSEPLAALLLVPGLAMIARKQRRRRKKLP